MQPLCVTFDCQNEEDESQAPDNAVSKYFQRADINDKFPVQGEKSPHQVGNAAHDNAIEAIFIHSYKSFLQENYFSFLIIRSAIPIL